MIKLERVCKTYGSLEAVKDLTLNISEGQIAVLLGPSGCGKSTTIRLINKLIPVTRGKISVDGKDINDYPVEQLRRGIGYVVQSIGLFPHMTVEDNISVVPKLLKWEKDKIRSRTEEMLELVGLDVDAYIRKHPHELSGGEAQRVGVARALAANPPVILMDEPFGAVDPLNRKRLQNEFLKIHRQLGKTVVFVTHDVEEAIKMGDKIAVMNHGVLEDCDSPEGLILHNDNQVIRNFLGKEYAVKILTKYLLGDVMDREKTDLADGSLLNEEDTMMSALSHMIEKSADEVSVSDAEGRTTGRITIDHVIKALRESDND